MTAPSEPRKIPQLAGREIRELRARGHHLEPVLIVGREGITHTVLRSLEEALEARQLIKIKLGPNCALDKQGAARTLAAESASALVQLLGRTILLYRPSLQARGKDNESGEISGT